MRKYTVKGIIGKRQVISAKTIFYFYFLGMCK